MSPNSPNQLPAVAIKRDSLMERLAAPLAPKSVEVSTQKWQPVMHTASLVGNVFYFYDSNPALCAVLPQREIRLLAAMRVYTNLPIKECRTGFVRLLKDDLVLLGEASKIVERLLERQTEGVWATGRNRIYLQRFVVEVAELCEDISCLIKNAGGSPE